VLQRVYTANKVLEADHLHLIWVKDHQWEVEAAAEEGIQLPCPVLRLNRSLSQTL
jgi:hypothetical protein